LGQDNDYSIFGRTFRKDRKDSIAEIGQAEHDRLNNTARRG
jgi:hypothetical protein